MTALSDRSVFKAGDVIGFSGNGFFSRAIEIGTYGIFGGCSHVGIIVAYHPHRLLMFESTTLSSEPCEVTGEFSKGMQAHPMRNIAKSYDGDVFHYPLTRPLYPHELRRLTQFAVNMIHVPYDMAGAIRSAGILISELEGNARGQDLSSLFCSEFVAAALSLTGVWHTSNASKYNPNKLLRRLRQDGIIAPPRRLT